MAQRVDILIVGNGAAGNAAALSARRTDPELSVMILGGEAHTEYAAPALPDYLSGGLSRAGLMVKTHEDYTKNNIQLRLRAAVDRILPEEKLAVLADGSAYAYGKLILATGSFPVRLGKMRGADLPGNFVLKTIDDVDAMAAYKGRRAVVVGSGAVGLEGGLGLKARGYETVTVVEGLEWISMRSFDRETADEVVKALRKNGLEVRSGEAVVSVEGTDRVRAVRTARRAIPCDLVLWGIGVRPRVELAQKTGVALGELGGIRVDDHMRTSVPDIYACGDCTESVDRLSGNRALHLFWEPAVRGGCVAGVNCAGGDKAFDGSVALFLTHIGETPVAAAGKTELELKGTRYQVREERDHGRYRRILTQGGKVVGVQMVNTLEGVSELLCRIRKDAGAELP